MTRNGIRICLYRVSPALLLLLASTGLGCSRDNAPDYETPGAPDASETMGTGTAEPGVSDMPETPASPAISGSDTLDTERPDSPPPLQ